MEKEEKEIKETGANPGSIATKTSTEGAEAGTTGTTGTESTGTDTTRTEAGAEEKEKEKIISRMAHVTDSEKEKILKAKKKAGIISEEEKKELRTLSKNRRAKEKYEKEKAERDEAGISQLPPIPVQPAQPKEEPKPKRKRVRKKKIDSEQVENLLFAVFNFISTKEDFEHWKMTKAQAKEIAVPLCEVLEKYDKLSGITNNSTEISLVIAVCSFVIPNVVITVNKRKEKKKDGTKGIAVGSVGKKLDEKRPSKPRTKSDTKPVTTDRSGNVENSGIFGQPLI